MIKYLDLTGLTKYDEKIKQYIGSFVPSKSLSLQDAFDSTKIVKMGICTQAEYDALGNNWIPNCLYIISDDTTLEDIYSELDLKADKLNTYTTTQVDNIIDNLVVNGYEMNAEDMQEIFDDAYSEDPVVDLLDNLNGEVV